MKAHRLHHRGRPWLVAFSLLAWVAGCQLLIDGELAVIHCQAEGETGPPACPVGQICRSGSCVEKASVFTVLGTPCLGDGDCASGDFCLDPAQVGGEGPALCSRACCVSSDCEPTRGFICWTSPQRGGGHCRAASEVGRAAPGTAKPGQSCDRDDDCRSGLCDAATHSCADGCCSNTNCSAGNATCRFDGGASPSLGFACDSKPSGDRPDFEECTVDADCTSGLCVDVGGKNRCAAPCCSSVSCGAISINGDAIPVGCIYVEHEGARVRVCARLPSSKLTKVVGEPCTLNDDCRSGLCVSTADGERYCTDACCSDDSCGDQALFACRPTLLTDAWDLRCVPK